MLIDFQNSFTARLSKKFATRKSLHIPPHFKDTAALPCKTVMFKNLHKFNSTVLKKRCFEKKFMQIYLLIF